MARVQTWSTYVGALGIALVVAAFLLGIVGGVRRDMLLFLGALGIVLVAFYILARPHDPSRRTAEVRTVSRGARVLLLAFAFIGILAAVNYLAANHFRQRLDMTATQQHTLSSQTVQVLQNLQEPVNVIGFFTPQVPRTEAEALLNDYKSKTDKLVVQFVDPDENPTLAQKYDLAQPGTLIFEKGARTEKVYNYDESTFTNAILRVTQTEQPAIYFTTGHGEYAPDNFDAEGIGAVAERLKQLNYKVAPLNLATISDTLPADTRALVIAGPTKPFSAQDEKHIQDYLDKGGRVLLLTEPNADPGLSNLLAAWGLELENNLVLDPGLNYRGNAPIPLFLQFPRLPVTKNLEKYGVYFPGARALKEKEGGDKMATALFTTTEEACAKTDFEQLAQQHKVECAEGDAKGPFTVGYAVEGAGGGGANAAQRARLIVVGNAAFATNHWMQNQDALGNLQLFDNMINWLAGQEQLIAIPPRDPNTRPLAALTGSEVNLVAWTSIVLIPLAALVIGGLLWWRRR